RHALREVEPSAGTGLPPQPLPGRRGAFHTPAGQPAGGAGPPRDGVLARPAAGGRRLHRGASAVGSTLLARSARPVLRLWCLVRPAGLQSIRSGPRYGRQPIHSYRSASGPYPERLRAGRSLARAETRNPSDAVVPVSTRATGCTAG